MFQIGLVQFSDYAYAAPGKDTIDSSTCYNRQLAYAIRDNVRYLESFIDTLTPNGGTNYIKALDKAFDLILNTDNSNGQKRGKHDIVFLSVTEQRKHF